MFHFFKRKKRHYYISPLDKALGIFRKNRPLTPSQQHEINKHQRIAALRDHHPEYLSK